MAIKLIKEHGGIFIGHGARHDGFEMPWGTKVQVPRHKGDFSSGVEDDIRKRATGAAETSFAYVVGCGKDGGMERYLYQAIITPNDIGGFDARIPEFDLITQGDSLSDAAFMAQDVLTLHISGLLAEGATVKQVGKVDYDCPENGFALALVVLAEAETVLDDTMTVQEAAEVLDVSRSRIYAMIEEGILSSRKEGNMRLVDARDVMDRFNNPRRAGRPSKQVALG